jgi:hypothetical protein
VRLGLARARLAGGDSDDALRLTTEALEVFTQRGSILGVHAVARIRSEFVDHGLHAAVKAMDAQAQAFRQAQ